MINDLKNKFPNFKYDFTKSFIEERLEKKLLCKAFFYLSPDDLIKTKLKKIMSKKLTKALRITVNFVPEVPLSLQENIYKHFISCSSNFEMNKRENKIVFSGSLKEDLNLMKFFTELTNYAKDKRIIEGFKKHPFYKSSIECFQFEEELFSEESLNMNYTTISEETMNEYTEVSQKLSEIRDHAKTFFVSKNLFLNKNKI